MRTGRGGYPRYTRVLNRVKWLLHTYHKDKFLLELNEYRGLLFNQLLPEAEMADSIA